MLMKTKCSDLKLTQTDIKSSLNSLFDLKTGQQQQCFFKKRRLFVVNRPNPSFRTISLQDHHALLCNTEEKHTVNAWSLEVGTKNSM